MNLFNRFFKKFSPPKEPKGGTEKRNLEATAHPELQSSRATIWTVGGGKGGVGKSLITTNLGILLSQTGKRVLLVDADLGAANLHTFLKLDNTQYSISSFIKSNLSDISPVVSSTPLPNLDIVSGARDSLDVANLNGDKMVRLRNALKRADYDYIILDIGPGTSTNMLDFFLMAHEGVLITTPEPTSIENTYRFIKCTYLRRIKNIINSQKNDELKNLLQKVLFNENAPRTIAEIISELTALDREKGGVLKRLIGNTSVSIIVNQIRLPQDHSIGPSIQRTCYDYFGLDVRLLGQLPNDESVLDSIRTCKPLVLDYKYSDAAMEITTIFEKLRSNGDMGGSTNPMNREGYVQ